MTSQALADWLQASDRINAVHASLAAHVVSTFGRGVDVDAVIEQLLLECPLVQRRQMRSGNLFVTYYFVASGALTNATPQRRLLAAIGNHLGVAPDQARELAGSFGLELSASLKQLLGLRTTAISHGQVIRDPLLIPSLMDRVRRREFVVGGELSIALIECGCRPNLAAAIFARTGITSHRTRMDGHQIQRLIYPSAAAPASSPPSLADASQSSSAPEPEPATEADDEPVDDAADDAPWALPLIAATLQASAAAEARRPGLELLCHVALHRLRDARARPVPGRPLPAMLAALRDRVRAAPLGAAVALSAHLHDLRDAVRVVASVTMAGLAAARPALDSVATSPERLFRVLLWERRHPGEVLLPLLERYGAALSTADLDALLEAATASHVPELARFPHLLRADVLAHFGIAHPTPKLLRLLAALLPGYEAAHGLAAADGGSASAPPLWPNVAATLRAHGIATAPVDEAQLCAALTLPAYRELRQCFVEQRRDAFTRICGASPADAAAAAAVAA